MIAREVTDGSCVDDIIVQTDGAARRLLEADCGRILNNVVLDGRGWRCFGIGR